MDKLHTITLREIRNEIRKEIIDVPIIHKKNTILFSQDSAIIPFYEHQKRRWFLNVSIIKSGEMSSQSDYIEEQSQPCSMWGN